MDGGNFQFSLKMETKHIFILFLAALSVRAEIRNKRTVDPVKVIDRVVGVKSLAAGQWTNNWTLQILQFIANMIGGKPNIFHI